MKKTVIEEIIQRNPQYYYREILRDYPEFYQSLGGKGKFAAQLYAWLHHDAIEPTCEGCDKKTTFIGISKGFRRYCGAKCAGASERVKGLRATTNEKKYGSKNSGDHPDVKAKRAATNMKKFGFASATQHPDVKAKSKATWDAKSPEERSDIRARRGQTCLERYGDEHPAKTQGIKDKTTRTCQDRYGVSSTGLIPSVLSGRQSRKHDWIIENWFTRFTTATPLFQFDDWTNVHAQYDWLCNRCGNEFTSHVKAGGQPKCTHCYPPEMSRGHAELYHFVESLTPGWSINDRTQIHPKELDLVHHERRIALEFNGILWHCDRYVDRNYHRDKSLACQAQQLDLIHVFEDDWAMRRPLVENHLRRYLGVGPRMEARDCRLMEISQQQAWAWLHQHAIRADPAAGGAHALIRQREIQCLLWRDQNNHWRITHRDDLLVLQAVAAFAACWEPRALAAWPLHEGQRGDWQHAGWQRVGHTQPQCRGIHGYASLIQPAPGDLPDTLWDCGHSLWAAHGGDFDQRGLDESA